MTKARDLADFLGDNTSLNTINNAYAAGTLVPSSTNPSLIINGDMKIAQRANSSTSDGYVVVDRFFLQAQAGNNGTTSYSQSTDGPTGFANSLKIECTSTDSVIGSTQYSRILYNIEGNVFSSLGGGTSWAKSFTVSFWVKSSLTGTYGVTTQNTDVTRGMAKDYTINSANTWEYKTVTFTGDTSGTWATDTSLGARINFGLATGSSRGLAPSNTWSNFDARGSSNQVNWMATLGNTFYITGIKVEEGSEATDFQHVSYADELAKCQRYYQKFSAEDSIYQRYSTGICFSSSNCSTLTTLPVTMRVIPTLETSGTASHFAVLHKNSAVSTCSSIPTLSTSGSNSTQMNIGCSTTGLTTNNVGQLIAKSTSAYLAFDGEI
jgi:hypothetical protein